MKSNILIFIRILIISTWSSLNEINHVSGGEVFRSKRVYTIDHSGPQNHHLPYDYSAFSIPLIVIESIISEYRSKTAEHDDGPLKAADLV